MNVSRTVFEILTKFILFPHIYPTSPLFDALLGETSWNFWMKLIPQKL